MLSVAIQERKQLEAKLKREKRRLIKYKQLVV